MIEILDAGPLTTVQDAGRSGYAALGVPQSGGFDRGAMQLANRLVGNAESAAVLEVTFGGLAFRLLDAATVALTGAPCASAASLWGTPTSLAAGAVVHLGPPESGLRSYLAIRGGVEVAVQLGSRSTDSLSGLGPAPMKAGDRVAIGSEIVDPVLDIVYGTAPPDPVLHVVLGPRDDWFTPESVEAFLDTDWTVRPDSNRVGIRLDGPALRRIRTDELPSEPTLPGAVQVPPDGRPIVLGPDAPVTGGYPVIAVVNRADVDIAAQLRPGDSVQFAVSRSTGAAPPRTVPPRPPRRES